MSRDAVDAHEPTGADWRQRFVEDFGGLVLVYGTPRAVMRVLGWMLVCDPPEQTARQIQEELALSAGSVSAAVRTLGDVGMLERVARPGDRHLYYRLCAHGWERVVELRFRAFAELRRTADRAIHLSQGQADERLAEMRDFYAHLEAGGARLLRESLERGSVDAPAPGTTPFVAMPEPGAHLPAPGPAEGPAHEHLQAMRRDECLLRLRAHGVGRLGVRSGDGVAVFPVNYAVADDSVVVRVRRGGALDAATRDARVALEIDHADTLYHEGWSVLVVGPCTHVSDPDELGALSHLPLLPWGDEGRDLCLRIAMESVTGRSIHHRAI